MNINANEIITALQNAEKNQQQFNALLNAVKKFEKNLEQTTSEIRGIIEQAESGNLQVRKRGGGRKKGSLNKNKAEQQ